MFKVDKVITVTVSPHHHTLVELPILEAVENLLNYRPISYLTKTELSSSDPRKRKFRIHNAYTQRDK